MPNNDKLKKVYNLKKRAKKAEKKAYSLGDGYHANEPGSTKASDKKMFRNMDKSDRLTARAKKIFRKEKSKTEPTDYNLSGRSGYFLNRKDMKDSPLNKALVGNQDQLPDQLKKQILAAPEDSPVKMYDSPVKMYDSPVKYMTPMASESGFKMKMGSKEKFSDGNFSQKDNDLISSAPSIMKDNYGGESIEMKDQGSPMAFKGQSKFKEEAPSQAALALKMADKRTEQNAQGLQNALSVASAVGDIAKTASGAGLLGD